MPYTVARPKWKFKRLRKFSETRLKTHTTSRARFVFSHSLHMQHLLRPLCMSFLNRHNLCLCTFFIIILLSVNSARVLICHSLNVRNMCQPFGRRQLSHVYLLLLLHCSMLHRDVCCAAGLFPFTYQVTVASTSKITIRKVKTIKQDNTSQELYYREINNLYQSIIIKAF
jgi:hypothetical protein